MTSRRQSFLRVVLAAVAALAPARAFADGDDDFQSLDIGTSYLKDATLRLYGFVETDAIYDTTQSFNEVPDENLVAPRTVGGKNNYAGENGRAQFSARNSRIGLDLNVPDAGSGLKTRAVFEMDFLGNNAPNTAPGTTPGAQSESNFFNNGAMRVRHAYVDVTDGELTGKAGQYWSLLGWQPYYFPGEVVIFSTPGQLYRRFPQFRATEAHPFGNGDWLLEAAADAAKPAEMNSGLTEEHAGLRLSSKRLVGASINGAGTSMVGLSAALSAALIPVRSAAGNATGSAVAFDFLVPLIPSADGRSRRNNLILVGEALSGSGVGGTEYPALALGVPSVGATAATGTAIDGGIAGLNNQNVVQLLQYRVFRSNLQYSLDERWSASAGYAQVEGRNLGSFPTAVGIAPKIQYGYADVMFDPRAWLRLSLEVSRNRDTYDDPNNRFAADNRCQFSAYFKF